jgi:hypothetical protein
LLRSQVQCKLATARYTTTAEPQWAARGVQWAAVTLKLLPLTSGAADADAVALAARGLELYDAAVARHDKSRKAGKEKWLANGGGGGARGSSRGAPAAEDDERAPWLTMDARGRSRPAADTQQPPLAAAGARAPDGGSGGPAAGGASYAAAAAPRPPPSQAPPPPLAPTPRLQQVDLDAPSAAPDLRETLMGRRLEQLAQQAAAIEAELRAMQQARRKAEAMALLHQVLPKPPAGTEAAGGAAQRDACADADGSADNDGAGHGGRSKRQKKKPASRTDAAPGASVAELAAKLAEEKAAAAQAKLKHESRMQQHTAAHRAHATQLQGTIANLEQEAMEAHDCLLSTTAALHERLSGPASTPALRSLLAAMKVEASKAAPHCKSTIEAIASLCEAAACALEDKEVNDVVEEAISGAAEDSDDESFVTPLQDAQALAEGADTAEAAAPPAEVAAPAAPAAAPMAPGAAKGKAKGKAPVSTETPRYGLRPRDPSAEPARGRGGRHAADV